MYIYILHRHILLRLPFVLGFWYTSLVRADTINNRKACIPRWEARFGSAVGHLAELMACCVFAASCKGRTLSVGGMYSY